MATGLAAVTAAVAWTRNQWDGWQTQRRERKRRNWHGYIDVGGINTVPVRLAEPPKTGGAPSRCSTSLAASQMSSWQPGCAS